MKANIIKGTVKDFQNGEYLSGARVEAWSIEAIIKVPLSTAVTNENGRFEMTFTQADAPALLGKNPFIYFKIFQESQILTGEYNDRKWNVTQITEEIQLLVNRNDSKNSKSANTVIGTVYGAKLIPVINILVKAFDKDLRSEEYLGEAYTDTEGKYTINYRKPSFEKNEYQSADILMRVYQNEKVLFETGIDDILFNAPKNALIDIHLTESLSGGLSEFENYTNIIKPLAGNIPFDELGETKDLPDITFLKSETGLDYAYLEYFVLSFKIQKQFQLLPAFFYAIFREGTLLSNDLSQWLTTRVLISIDSDIKELVYETALLSQDIINADINKAIKANIIPDIRNQLPEILKQLEGLRNDATNYIQQERPQQWANLVVQSIQEGSYKNLVQLINTNAHGDLPQLLDNLLAANPFKNLDSANAASVNINMASVLGTDTQLIEHVKNAANIKEEKDVRQLAALSVDDLKKMLRSIPDEKMRASIAGTDELVTNHAKILSKRFAQKYPHTAFISQFKRDDEHLYQEKDKMVEAINQIPDINLGGKPVDTQLKNIKTTDETKQQLRALQRLYKLTPDYNKVKKLQSTDIHSSDKIVALGKKQFVSKVTKDQTFTPEEANNLYQKAVNIHAAAIALGAELKDYASIGGLEALNGKALSMKIEQISKDFPNLQSLFKGTDLCECEDCRSVYGPASYLADVLQFLKNRFVTGGTKTAKDVLFKRRPDIGDIDLNCDNAKTPIPYIDLVCEVLEEAVAPDNGVLLDSTYTVDMVIGGINSHLLNGLITNGFNNITSSAILYPKYSEVGIDTYILRDAKSTTKISVEGTGWRVKILKETHLTATELNAAPEYINYNAYNTLQTSNISFSLPFDLYQQESNKFLEIVGIDRSELMNTFRNVGGPDAPSIAAVFLKITSAERTLIVTPDITEAGQAIYWNTGGSPLINTLQEVDVFLKKSGLTYADLQGLLKQSFINPGNVLYIQHLDGTCNTAEKIIVNLDVNALDRMHRFLRLFRRTGLSMSNLNRIITYPGLSNQQLNDNTLVLIYQLLKIQRNSGVTIEQAISFYGLMPYDSDTALYQSVYLNRIATNPVDDAFTLVKIQANESLPVAGRDTLTAHLNTLLLSLRLKADDVNFLINQLNPADTTLTRDNLSFLYKNVLLAKSLGIKVQDLYTISILSGKPIFTSPGATNNFIAVVIFIQSSGFTVSDLKWYLQNNDPTGFLSMKDDAITTWLISLQSEYQKAFSSSKSTFDASLSSDQNKNDIKQNLVSLPGLSSQIVDKIMSIISGQFTDTLTPQAYVDANLATYFDTTDIKNKIITLQALAPDDPLLDAAKNDLIQSLSTSVSAYLFNEAKKTALYTAVEATFGSTDVITQVLLNNGFLKLPVPPALLLNLLTDDSLIDKVNNPPVLPDITSATFDTQYRSVRLLNLIISYLNKISIQAKDLQWFLQNSNTMGWLELDTLRYQADVAAADFDKWVKVQRAFQLMRTYSTVQSPADPTIILSWTDVWNMVATGASQAEAFNLLALFTGWGRGDILDLNTYFSYNYPASYTDPATYLQLDKATAALRLLGVPVSIASQFIKPVLTSVDAGLIVQTLRNKYQENQWLKVIQPVEDALRPQKRDALVAYLLASNPDLEGTDDLYDYFIMDVEMQPGQPSSRIVMAHGILQLFIQRCLMALEPDAIADVTIDDGWNQWEWMKNFQVWVANRKIFLYPENWIQPELRLDKSYFFSDLISELQQNQVTDDNVEIAAIHYLEKLDDVATLDVRACYYDISTYTNHVIARVRGGNTYYYRTCVKERKWEPWTKVDVDISGDHLLAYMHNNRLFLAWPLPAEEIKQDQSISIPSTPSTTSAPPPQKRYKIQLAVSEFLGGIWQPKRTSQDYLYTDYYTDIESYKDIFRMIDFNMGIIGLGIFCTFNYQSIGMFNLTGCKGYPEVAYWGNKSMPDLDFIPDFLDTDFLQMQYREEDGRQTNTFAARSIFSPFNYQEILHNTPGTFRITYPHEFSLIDWIYIALEILSRQNNYSTKVNYGNQRGIVMPMASFMPFFYADGEREYVIIPGFFDERGVNERTFSDIYKFLTDLIALVKKYILLLIADPAHDFNKLIQELYADTEYIRLKAEWDYYKSNKPKLMFRNFYHPLVCFIKSTVYNGGLKAIMTYDIQSKVTSFDFNNTYNPQPVVATPYPIEDIDFTSDGSYSSYNWELFYHLPFFIANQLSQNQQFEKARNWYHYIFNPIGGAGGSAPQKYWITKPFHEFFDYVDQRIDTILTDIASDPTGTIYADLTTAVENWRENPFMPHEVARTRPLAYQKALLMNYLDNLIAWGDNLFMQNTMESLVQATQMYILADKILGPKPMIIPPAVPVPDKTYNQLESKLDSFSNAMIDLENLVPDLNILPHKGAELPTPPTSFSSLYFCIPANTQFLSYWNTIDDRLYKIRNSEDINGVHRVLALFAPSIDPGMLVRAVAGGMDISSVITMLNAPLPLYRFNVIIQKATELIEEVKALGSALLSALEKKDAEALALLRAGEEINLQKQILLIRQSQIDEATQSIEELNKSKAISQKKYDYYNGRDFMNGWEIAQAAISGGAIISEIIATVLDATSVAGHMVPTFTAGGAGIGGSPLVTVAYGGFNVGASTGKAGTLFRGLAGILNSTAGLIGNIGAYQRRMDDWNFQKDTASLELNQIDQQIVVANIQKDIATKESSVQQTRIQQAQEVNTFMNSKFTNKDLYAWMTGQISTLYFQSYQLAFGMAKKAEQCFQFELAADSDVIQFNYWDTMKKGLLSGDKLLLDIKRLESNYYDNNKRELELIKSISVANLSPQALLQLKNTGECDITIPEMLFDMDYPGQYLRRIKSISLNIPCVSGPLVTIACTLSLVSNKYRKNTLLNPAGADAYDKFVEKSDGDDRFSYNIGSIQSIATSHAQNDSGLFELNFQDPRYLPFEGTGAISSWHLEMNDPSVLAQFDYQSISDVIMQISYTAREGGSLFKKETIEYLKLLFKKIVDSVPVAGLYRMFDLKHEFPNNWYALMADGTGTFNATFSKANLPYFTQNTAIKVTIQSVALFILDSAGDMLSITMNGSAVTPMIKDATKFGNEILFLDPITSVTGDLKASSDSIPVALGLQNFAAVKNNLNDCWLILNYTITL